ncbi:hypothetical protein RhiirA5_414644 [Rhizophagus irregularis]|uniref:Uncharacterized protein n=1 Tax=Rhizophagus irregularis TaxID=588596 RepID=A0A2I1EHC3_9GLOM|nr:hypothetical protein RhiirA5_414644 [Rhizophagus irregularis]PKC60951.1 hypothetical protein RhiirA1_467289 [Rhizophagus irregularis]PKY21510.1 hypothetical protein RhiirB3_435131 [Rhizophagus irregularis]CAB4485829.1 unnamed protein product [Rhizophagus irregularis]CAB5203486.1 unnamed protein product [Rhizophagus irregularis]
MVPKKVAAEVHYSKYWVRPEFQCGLDSWDHQDKYPEKAKRESHIALEEELKSGKKKEKFPKQVDSEDSENNPKALNVDCLWNSISHYKIIFLPKEYANDVYEQKSTVNEFAIEDVEVLIRSYNNSISTVDRTMLNVLDTTFLGINEFNMKKD